MTEQDTKVWADSILCDEKLEGAMAIAASLGEAIPNNVQSGSVAAKNMWLLRTALLRAARHAMH